MYVADVRRSDGMRDNRAKTRLDLTFDPFLTKHDPEWHLATVHLPQISGA